MKVRPEHGDPKTLTFLELNARYMRHETFAQLVANLRKDGALSSTPFVWKAAMAEPDSGEPTGYQDGDLVILSGNHRTKAAVEAGIQEIHWLQCDEPLTRAQRIAIQLSHNSLAGEDDPSTLAQLYESIDDLDLREYAGLDDRQLGLLANVTIDNLTEANLEFQQLSLTFLPEDAERARSGFKDAEAMSSNADDRWLARLEDHVRLLDALAQASAAHDVRNMAAALAYVLDIYEQHRTDLDTGWTDGNGDARHKNWLPFVVVAGNDMLPASQAATIRKALQKMSDRGEIGGRHEWYDGLARLATDYLGTG